MFTARQGGARQSPPDAFAGERGQAVVEFALSLTLLLLLLFTALDFGRAFFNYVALVNAAREGARRGVVSGSSEAIEPAVRQEVQGNGLDPARLTVVSQWGGSGGSVVVNVSYDFPLVTTSILPFSSLTLRTTATMLIP